MLAISADFGYSRMSMVEGQPEICGRGGQNLNLVEGEAADVMYVVWVGKKKKN